MSNSKRPRKLQTKEGLKKDKLAKKKAQEERLELDDGSERAARSDGWHPRWLTGFAPGTLEYRTAYALVEGYEDRDTLAESLGVDRRFLAKVEKRLRKLGYEREEVVRWKPPIDRLGSFTLQRRTANQPSSEECPF